MLRNKFGKSLAVSSGVFLTFISVANISALAKQEFDWYSVFLYYLTYFLRYPDLTNVKEKKPTSSKNESKSNALSANFIKETIGLENNEEEFLKAERTLKDLYREKARMEQELSEGLSEVKKGSSEYWDYHCVKSSLIEVCEKIGRIEGTMTFCRICAKQTAEKILNRFSAGFCLRTVDYLREFQTKLESGIYDNGVIEETDEKLKNTNQLISSTAQLQDCICRLKSLEGKMDIYSKRIGTDRQEDLTKALKDTIPFSEIVDSAISSEFIRD